jgi:hypothetical protein
MDSLNYNFDEGEAVEMAIFHLRCCSLPSALRFAPFMVAPNVISDRRCPCHLPDASWARYYFDLRARTPS